MDDLVTLLDEKLRQQFTGSQPALESLPLFPSEKDALAWEAPSRVGGFLVWGGFDGIGHRERQRQVWDFLRAELSAEELQRVSAVLTLTPLEEQVMLESE